MVARARREGHPEQRANTVWHRGRDERPRQPRTQRSAAMEWRAEPGAPGDQAQPQDRRSIARSTTLGPHSLLVPGPERWTEAAKHRDIDLVLGKSLHVLRHAEFFEPIRNLLHRGAPLRQTYCVPCMLNPARQTDGALSCFQRRRLSAQTPKPNAKAAKRLRLP
jgi:hypothetical protein